jgi:hypothetical protein
MTQSLGIDKATRDKIEQIEADIARRLRGRICGFRLSMRETGLVLQGSSNTYYAKQLAQHAVMEIADWPIRANDIEVI